MTGMREYGRRLVATMRDALRHWTGDAEYERFVQRCRVQGEIPLDRGRYFARRLEEKYSGVRRCC